MGDADGRHPHAEQSWVGQTFLNKFDFGSPDGTGAADHVMYSLDVPIPKSLHEQVLRERPVVRAMVTSWEWEGSQFGLLVVKIGGSHAVVCGLPIAGRRDLAHLAFAAARGKLAVGLATDADPTVTPMARVVGFEDAFLEVKGLPMLLDDQSARAVHEIRRLLRGPWAMHFLGHPPQVLETLVVTVCPFDRKDISVS